MNWKSLLQALDDLLWAIVKGDAPKPPVISMNPAPSAPITPKPDVMATPPIQAPITLRFDTPRNAYSSVRVLCDNAGLTLEEKNLICAVIFQESRFFNTALNHNRNKQGVITSTDYGICQINDYFHIGPTKDFPTVQYVKDHPEAVVKWMIGMYKHGLLKQWVGFSSKAYLRWLTPGSPMWKLQ